jgi:hypothetical protein
MQRFILSPVGLLSTSSIYLRRYKAVGEGRFSPLAFPFHQSISSRRQQAFSESSVVRAISSHVKKPSLVLLGLIDGLKNTERSPGGGAANPPFGARTRFVSQSLIAFTSTCRNSYRLFDRPPALRQPGLSTKCHQRVNSGSWSGFGGHRISIPPLDQKW